MNTQHRTSNTEHQIKNIVFDIGNVICEWNPEKLVSSVFPEKTDQQEALNNIIKHPDWLLLDKGVLTLDKAIDRAESRCRLTRKQIIALFDATPASLVPFPETVSVARDLHQRGFPLYVLSNMHDYAFDYLTANYDFWELFKGIVVSSHIKSIKPEPVIYKYLLGEYGLTPKNTVFLDDMGYNLEAAEKVGIQTILINPPGQTREKLYQFLSLG